MDRLPFISMSDTNCTSTNWVQHIVFFYLLESLFNFIFVDIQYYFFKDDENKDGIGCANSGTMRYAKEVGDDAIGEDCGTLVPGHGGTLLPDQQPDLGTMVINSDSDEPTMKRMIFYLFLCSISSFYFIIITVSFK